MPDPRRLEIVRNWLTGGLLFVALIWFLRVSASVTMPLTISLLLALAVWPVSRHVRDHVPNRLRWLGTLAALLVLLLVLGLFLAGLGIAADQVIELVRSLAPDARERLDTLGLEQFARLSEDASASDMLGPRLFAALGVTAQAVLGTLLILFLVVLLISESRTWHDKIKTISASGKGKNWFQIGSSVGEKFRAYFFVRLALGSITALLYVAWLAAFGIEHLVLWGTLTLLLNFIPTVGSIISGSLPVAFALFQRDPGTAAAVAAGLFAIEQVMGNYVDPKLTGRRLSVSPFVVLVSLTFWSWLWGLPGALLAVPLTVLLTMVLAHFDRLKPIALFLTSASNFQELDEYRGSR